MDVSLVTYTVADLTKAKRFFRELTGADPYADSPGYVGYRSGDMEIGLVPSGDKREPGALAYWTVSDIAASVEALIAAGGTVVQEITDVAYGLLVASVKDPNGATVGLTTTAEGMSTEARPKLEEIRKIIKSGVPFSKYHGRLAGFAVYQNHVSFGIDVALQSKDREMLEEQGTKPE